MKHFDAVIIGTGLAGLQCARLLARRGAKILLVDRKSDLTKGVHTTGIFVRKTFEDFEFPEGTLGKPIKNVALYSPKLKSISLESEKDEFRVGKMSLIYDEFLQNAVAEGVRFACATRYLRSEPSAVADGLTSPSEVLIDKLQPSATADGSDNKPQSPATAGGSDTIVTLEKKGEVYQVKTKVLIGADGPRRGSQKICALTKTMNGSSATRKFFIVQI